MALEFRIELAGNFAGALEKSAQAADQATSATAKTRKETELFASEIGNAKGELAGFTLDLQSFGKGGSLFTFDLASGLRSAVDLAGALIGKIFDIGQEIAHVAAEKQDIDLAVRLNVGDEKAAAVDKLAEQFESVTRFDAGDIKKALLPLLKQGFGDVDALGTVATIATDLAAKSAGGIGDVQQTISSFASIFQRGRLKPAQLEQFGIVASDYFEQLGLSMGVSAAEAEKAAKSGKAGQDKLLQVVAQMVAAKQGGAIGGTSLRADEKLGATLARLGNLKNNLFEGLADSPGLKRVQGALENIIGAVKGDLGDKITGVLGAALDQVGEWLEWLTSPAGIAKVGAVFDEVIAGVKEMVRWLRDSWPDITAGANELWTVLKGIAKVVGVIIDGWAKLIDLAHDFDSGQILKDIKDTIKGEHGGIATGNTPKNMVWDEATQGYKPIPKMAEGGIVQRPTLALIGEAGPEAVVPLGGGGGLGNQITVNYAPVYQASGGNAGELRDELEASERRSRIEFKKVIDELLAS
jgi:hypothetical protein